MSDAKDDPAERGGNFTIIRGPEVPERSRPHPEIEGPAQGDGAQRAGTCQSEGPARGGMKKGSNQ